MKKLAILGASGHGRVIADAALLSGQWQEVLFFDDAFPQLTQNGGYQVKGNSADLVQSGVPAVVAIGDNKIRFQKSNWLLQNQVELVSIVHPAAVVASDSKIGAGTVVFAGAVVNAGARIGQHCIINSRAVIEHDCVLGDAVHVSPGASLGGNCQLADGAWVGIGAAVRHGTSIGEFAIVGTGAAVVKKVHPHEVVVGVPARPLKKNG
jgi:sugar O-acyltransferase (sialic acid O-acetyltransferase NeuD family)